MRVISFRGMDINGKWHHGLLAESAGFPKQPEAGLYISNTAGFPWAFQVRTETLGQCTGLCDKNGKWIYEGDILHCAIQQADKTGFIRDYTATVEEDICNPCFVLKQENGQVEYDFVMCDLMILEVIGNIYEHQHFLKEGNQNVQTT